MKVISALLLITNAVSAVDLGKTINEIVPNMATVAHKQAPNRALEVSAQCTSDFEALYQNPELINALEAWEAEIGLKILECFTGSPAGATTFECPLDSATFNSQADVVAACETLGGTTELFNYGIACDFSVEGTRVSFDLDYKNVPYCIPPTCSEEDVNEVKAQVAAIGDQLTEEGLAQAGLDNSQCTASLEGGAGETSAAHFQTISGATMLVIVLAVTTFVF